MKKNLTHNVLCDSVFLSVPSVLCCETVQKRNKSTRIINRTCLKKDVRAITGA